MVKGIPNGAGSSSHAARPEGWLPVGVTPSILGAIGRTPLVLLQRVAKEVPARILVKLEALNPGGSVKDRVGVAMVDEAERRGLLRPGGTIIEATAGNTGVGLALAAAVKGYRCIFVLPDKMSSEKIRLLKAYGAEIVLTPTSVPPDAPESYNGVADRLAREIPAPGGPTSSPTWPIPRFTIARRGPRSGNRPAAASPPLWPASAPAARSRASGATSRSANPEIRVIGADPEGSVLSGDSPKPWKVEGIGEDFVPKTLNGQVVDEWIRVGDAESFRTARAGTARGALGRGLVGHRGRRGPAVRAAAHRQRRRGGPLPRYRPQLSEQVLRRRLDGRKPSRGGPPGGRNRRRSAGPPRPARAHHRRARGHRSRSRRTDAVARYLTASRPPRRPAGGQHSGSHARPAAARPVRPHDGPRRRHHGTPPAPGRHRRSSRRGLSPAPGRQLGCAGDLRRRGRRHRHPHRPDRVLEPAHGAVEPSAARVFAKGFSAHGPRPKETGLLDSRDPRRPGRRPGDRGHGRADLCDLDLHSGSAGPAQGLRVFAQRQPDAACARDLPGRA